MNVPFPLGFPAPTAFYLTLYVLTFALHQAFMHYVLAGSLYVAWTTSFPGRNNIIRNDQPLASTLRDWLPFLLSAAITAGVAPLLFIQIVYQRQFYTANLLLWWRWMLVVPVLIVAFYLLYLLKSKIMLRWPGIVRSLVAVTTAVCFVFVGFCWSANHLLSVAESRWPEIYVTGVLPFTTFEILSRMGIWISDSFTTLAAILSWQMFVRQSERSAEVVTATTRTLANIALGGLGLLALFGVIYLLTAGAKPRLALFDTGTLPYLFLAFVGAGLQVTGWFKQWQLGRLTGFWSMTVSAGSVLALLGMSFAREAIRAGVIDMTQLYARHAEAAKVSGFAVFLIFTVLVSLVIAWCFVIVRQGLVARLAESGEPGSN
ncbi:MAG: hypothetical protein V4719_08010 [Planctomycetota bacterium]